MTPDELRAASGLGGRAFADFVARIEQVHQAVAGRAFGPARQAGAPARLIHDAVSRSVYLAVRSAGSAAGAMTGEIAAVLLGRRGQPAGAVPAGNLALAGLNAVAGDGLVKDTAPLAISMAVRAVGRDIGLTAADLAAAFPGAAPRLALFVHGLGETENSWERHGDQAESYGSRLRSQFGYSPVYLRYNSGRHVSENGQDLAILLDRLTAAWPVPTAEILLVGHSMGGLVIRSACHYGNDLSLAWTRQVRHVFYLGSPHLGAPLARAFGLAGWALSLVPETRPFATMVNGSSPGIKDLRHGYVLPGDWAGCDQDTCLRDHRHDAPLLSGASHYAISATVTADPGSPVGSLVGDLLVTPASAHGRRGRVQHIAFPVEKGRRLGGMHHFDLLGHPAVWAAMDGLLQQAAD
jgi:triacylglycerol esterase/lipase EstA (alpha/beta hydrolase family)